MSNGTSKQVQKLQQVVAAAGQYLTAKSTLQLDGQPVKLSDFLAALNAAISADSAVTTAEAQAVAARSARTPLLATANAYVAALKTYLFSAYGKKALMLSAFGFAPKTRAVPDSATQAIAAAQRKLTRQARNTMGSKQRLGVTVSGKPGLVLVGPDGSQIPGAVQGPRAPGIAPEAATAAAQLAAPALSKPTIAG